MITTFNKIYQQPTLILLLILLILSGCNQNSDQREFEQQAFSEPTGITETDENGDITGNNDPDDWRISPFFQGDIELIFPPFPNPVQTNNRLTINIQVLFLERVREIYIRVYRPPSFYQIGPREPALFGGNTFRLNPVEIAGRNPNPKGTYRIIIQDENQNVITYGDIEIE